MKVDVKSSLAELMLSDETELPEDLRKKIRGIKDWDDEPTQVTKLMEELEAEAAETKAGLKKTGAIAGRVSRIAKRSQSYSNLKLVLSSRPPPPDGEGDVSSSE